MTAWGQAAGWTGHEGARDGDSNYPDYGNGFLRAHLWQKLSNWTLKVDVIYYIPITLIFKKCFIVFVTLKSLDPSGSRVLSTYLSLLTRTSSREVTFCAHRAHCQSFWSVQRPFLSPCMLRPPGPHSCPLLCAQCPSEPPRLWVRPRSIRRLCSHTQACAV